MALKLNIHNETSELDMVILGIAEDIYPYGINPKAKHYYEENTYPKQNDLLREINSFENVLIRNGVKVLRPQNLKKLTQIFTRDIGFVIDDTFFISTLIKDRKKEIQGIAYILDLFENIVDSSKFRGVQIEGGDVILMDNRIFVGLSKRTNQKGFEFLKDQVKNKNLYQIEVFTSDDYRSNVLHLDCTFQPIGKNHAIVYEEGIKNLDFFYEQLNLPQKNIFKVSAIQSYRMFPNIFSISDKKIIIEREFIELKYWLKQHRFEVIEVEYQEISKLSGLLRCSTLPLIRK